MPTLNISKLKDSKIDEATGLLLQEREPVTFSSSSLDSKFLKSSKFPENLSSQLSASEFVSLPDKLNRRNVSRGAEGGYDMAASISAWREEVAKYQPQLVRSQSQADFSKREYEQQSSTEAGPSYLWDSQRAVLNDKSNNFARTKMSCPSLLIAPYSFTPVSSDGEEAKGSASPVDQGAFSFPPLSVESQPSGVPETVDFSQPVFLRPQSRHMNGDQQASPYKRETGVSARDIGTSSAILDRQNLTSFDMIGSNSTITITDTREAILSTSGSVVDVIVLLQRLCGFSSNLLGIFLSRDRPQYNTQKSSFTRLKSKESFSDSGEKESISHKTSDAEDGAPSALDEQNLTASSGSEANSSFPGLKSWSTFTTTFSTTHPNPGTNENVSGLSRADNSREVYDIDLKAFRTNSQDFVQSDLKRDSRHTGMRAPSRIDVGHRKPSQEEQEPSRKFFSKVKTRLRLHLQILGVSGSFSSFFPFYFQWKMYIKRFVFRRHQFQWCFLN